MCEVILPHGASALYTGQHRIACSVRLRWPAANTSLYEDELLAPLDYAYCRPTLYHHFGFNASLLLCNAYASLLGVSDDPVPHDLTCVDEGGV